jgi:hypothetical protein
MTPVVATRVEGVERVERARRRDVILDADATASGDTRRRADAGADRGTSARASDRASHARARARRADVERERERTRERASSRWVIDEGRATTRRGRHARRQRARDV